MEHRRIIKQGGIVVCSQEDGSMDPAAANSQGLYFSDTRFLSKFQLYLNGLKPRLLGSTEESLFHAVFLHTNPDLTDLPTRSLGIRQETKVEAGVVTFQIGVINWTMRPAEVELSIEIDADFWDSFEARGVKREQRGQSFDPQATANTLEMKYVGLDHATRTTRIETTTDMARYDQGRMHFPLQIEPHAYAIIELRVVCTIDAVEGADHAYTPVLSGPVAPDWFDNATGVKFSNRIIQQIHDRSVEDLRILITEFPGLWAPAAGLPRFAVPFGRDSLFTSIETLCWNPRIAHDVLYFLSAVQGKEENPFTYEQPGKIMHELHTGELARLKEIPFGLFYGSVDSTALFLMAAAEYIAWTGDLDLYHDLKPNFDAAWKWISDYSNIDGSGYVQYKAHTAPKMRSAALTVGLFNQGWKDSGDALSYSDGTMTTDHPIALAEPQGYLYRALLLWSELYAAMPESEGVAGESARLRQRAEALKERFNQEFWMPEKQYYAMALDGHHRQVDIVTSNPAQCLWTGLIDEEHAEAMTRTLLDPSMASAWGIRTMANNEKAYNPLSYHNGSVWPFENALIAAGLKSYGLVKEAEQIFDLVVDAAGHFEYHRWPEVYAGVARDSIGVLALQPDASRPQAWSAGAIFLWLQTFLGITPRPFSKHVHLSPTLPESIERLGVKDLAIAGGRLSLALSRNDHGVEMMIVDNPQDLEITLHPATRSLVPA
jgi:glycogen debranching enzyme